MSWPTTRAGPVHSVAAAHEARQPNQEGIEMTDLRRSNLRKRIRPALAATAAVAAAAALLASTGAAQPSGTELHLTAISQKSAEFFPKRAPHPGDRLGFGDKLSGDDTGIDRAVCTVLGGGSQLPCNIWVKLSRGTIELQGMVSEKSHNTPIAVVGGTGSYNGARGTAYATDVSKTKTSIVVDLLP
jgi:hypothetical protein